ncbi:GSCFA domain-containing protein [uncultured Tenacibaculum sp.]|uniref:GSCFA domain-containing protein n=1 Tax=uncultured Tenacibaculum sp. TaxID=174713 RepID=UPI00261C2E59|nr:GSCFA domain-containing protein [uncultured Tenacibaculum sp.]
MVLSTNIPLSRRKHNLINYNSNILLLGSCFSENIGAKLAYHKFKTLENPFGILFHPKAIENLILKSVNSETYTEDDIFLHNERWHCFEAHSTLSSTNKEELLSNLNLAVNQTSTAIQNASHIIITLGTAWIYREIVTDSIVANCHKVPQKKFLKEILSVTEISESLEAIVALIKSINSKASIIFTVSPVRHIKDGFMENQRSKSHLLTAIHNIVEPRQNSFYFPSYEIMMDELRDYRFYAEDMIHPNKTAINYIWEKFTSVWFDENSFTTMKEVDTIQKGIQHKPFNPNSEAHQQFFKKLQQKKETLIKAFPHITF